MHEHRLPPVKLLHAFCRLVVGLLLAHQLLLLEKRVTPRLQS